MELVTYRSHTGKTKSPFIYSSSLLKSFQILLWKSIRFTITFLILSQKNKFREGKEMTIPMTLIDWCWALGFLLYDVRSTVPHGSMCIDLKINWILRLWKWSDSMSASLCMLIYLEPIEEMELRDQLVPRIEAIGISQITTMLNTIVNQPLTIFLQILMQPLSSVCQALC